MFRSQLAFLRANISASLRWVCMVLVTPLHDKKNDLTVFAVHCWTKFWASVNASRRRLFVLTWATHKTQQYLRAARRRWARIKRKESALSFFHFWKYRDVEKKLSTFRPVWFFCSTLVFGVLSPFFASPKFFLLSAVLSCFSISVVHSRRLLSPTLFFGICWGFETLGFLLGPEPEIRVNTGSANSLEPPVHVSSLWPRALGGSASDAVRSFFGRGGFCLLVESATFVSWTSLAFNHSARSSWEPTRTNK